MNSTIEFSDKCLLSNNIMDYHVVSQGKTTIPNVDDGEEMELTDVRKSMSLFVVALYAFHRLKNCLNL